MAKRVQSEAQNEYKKELERLLRIVRKGEQEGYIFPKDVVPRLPKHVTKQQLEEIKKIRAEDLYELADFIDKSTGEVIESSNKIRARKPTTRSTRVGAVSDEYMRHPRAKKPKEEKEPLTSEERSEIARQAWQKRMENMSQDEYEEYLLKRSESAKKAWQTRIENMSPEQYDEFVRKQVERMQGGREPKPKPVPLTAEEKAKRRSEASKKAWQTRVNNMTQEQYDKFVKENVERMQKGRAKKHANDYPTKTAIDSVTERVVDMAIRTGEVTPEEGEQIKEELSIDNFPTVSYYDGRLPEISRKGVSNWGTGGIKIWLSEKQNVLTIWAETLQRNANNLEELEEYLIAHMGEIDEAIQVAEYASVLEHALQGFANLGRVLNQGALSAIQAEALSNESEFIEYDEDSYNELAEMFMR